MNSPKWQITQEAHNTECSPANSWLDDQHLLYLHHVQDIATHGAHHGHNAFSYLQHEHMVCELRILPLAGLQTACIAHTHPKSATTDAVELIGIV